MIFGPYDEEDEALDALKSHVVESRTVTTDLRELPRGEISLALYYHPLSIYSQKVLIAMYEKGFDFERQIVNLMDEEARAQFREIYPMGKIPRRNRCARCAASSSSSLCLSPS